MRAGIAAILGLVAAVAAIGAVVAGSNAALVIPAATIAVVASALLLVSVLERVTWQPTPRGTPPRASSTRIRAALAAGKNGRRELIALLDALERGGFGVATPSLTIDELDRLLNESPQEFHRYLDARLTELERRT